MLGFTRIVSLMGFLAIPVMLSGCVGPRLPSDRYVEGQGSDEFHAGATCQTQQDGCDLEDEEPPKEVPWPRFHPIPTRPVFGISDR
jgi:hypothetical protein